MTLAALWKRRLQFTFVHIVVKDISDDSRASFQDQFIETIPLQLCHVRQFDMASVTWMSFDAENHRTKCLLCARRFAYFSNQTARLVPQGGIK